MKVPALRFATTLLLSLLAVSAAFGQGKIYLAEYKFNDPKVYRMDLDGTNVEDLGTLPTNDWLPVGVAFDETNQKLYWTHGSFNDSRIVRADLDGSNREVLISGLTNARGLALDIDGGKMYWSDTQDRAMYRANLNGTGLETIVSNGHQLGRPTLDLVNGKLYYGNFDLKRIERSNLDGAGTEIILATSAVEQAKSIALDLDAQMLYWLDSQTITNYVARVDLDGTGAEILVDFPLESSGLTNLELDLAAGKIYWCDEITANQKGVWMSNLDGTGASRIFTSPVGWNSGALTLALDGTPACATGTVDLAQSGPVDVVFVNGSTGGATRRVSVTDGDPIVGTIFLPPAGGNGKFVMHGNLGDPSAGAVTALPAGIGDVCFPFFLPAGASPEVIANNAGREPRVGASAFFGTETDDPPRATANFLMRQGDPNLPPGTVITFQGATFDPGSTSVKGASATNAVIVVVE